MTRDTGMTKPTFASEVEGILEEVLEYQRGIRTDRIIGTSPKKALAKIVALHEQVPDPDRFEVIDETGRAYVKGSIYGSPVKVELSYQDDGKTLKVFVSERTAAEGKHE